MTSPNPLFSIAAAVTLAAAPIPVAAAAAANPLLADWTGPHGGVPAFDEVGLEDFQPALEAAMAENLAEIDAIANNSAPATFDNTLAAMERSGRRLGRVGVVFGIWGSNRSTPEFQKIEAEMAPKLAAFSDRITQNRKLFDRIATVWAARETSGLTAEQKRLVDVVHTSFVQQGARLTPAQKAQLTAVNQRLAALTTEFGQNLLWDEANYTLVLESEADLAGLSASQIAQAAGEAERRGRKGKWVIANTRSAMEPFLVASTRRDLREKGWRMWTSRGDNGDAHDNNKIVAEILKLRAERAKLLGYPTYAHWRLADTMAKTPDAAMQLMLQVWKPATDQVRQDVAEMQAIVDLEEVGAEKGGFQIQPWDYRFYAEKVRKAKYDLDLEQVKPYLALDNVRDAMFWTAGQLYGFSFAEVEGLPVFDPAMSVWEVKDRSGVHIGLWYFDPYARPGKSSGAWMNAYRNQETFDGPVTTIVSNNSNFIAPEPGERVLISWDDAVTMFHEFGHALHGLSSNVTYPSLSGTSVQRDFVEFPSQINEHWLATPEVLNRFLKDANGNPIPAELVAKIRKAATFNQGFSTTEALASAIVDMRLHLAGDTPIDPDAFEKAVLAEIGMPPQIVMRHRIPQFAHVFTGDGYAAGYYSYTWAAVLEHDAWEAFTEAGGPFDPAVARRYHDQVLAVGNTVEPAEAYRRFRGRDPKVDALLRAKGFPVP